MSGKIDEIKSFLSADEAEMKKRYDERIERIERNNERIKRYNKRIDNNEFEECEGYLYTEDTAYKRVAPELIDKTPRQDEEIIKLSKLKTVPEIEGNVEMEDKERGIILTSSYNKKKGYHFNRLYDISEDKPVLVASGCLNYKDGMFIIDYTNKQAGYGRGAYLKHMQSALYKLDKGNKPHFVATKVLNILNDGWFEQSSGKDYSVYLCKDENNGKYRRVMNFDADMSGHREVTADGTIIDELDRSDWYHKDEYKYDAKKQTLKFVKGEGYESDDYEYYERNGFENNIRKTGLVIGEAEISVNTDQSLQPNQYTNDYDYSNCLEIKDTKTGQVIFESHHCMARAFDVAKKDNKLEVVDRVEENVKTFEFTRGSDGILSVETIAERPITIEEKYAYQYGIKGKYGTFYKGRGYSGGIFVDNNGNENFRFAKGNVYNRYYMRNPIYNGLVSVNERIYDFKNSCWRQDLEEIRDLGYKFYAAKKTGEKQFGIYEMADEKMEKPLIKVDDCELISAGSYSGDIRDASNNILFSIDDKKCRCEITSEGKLKPIAKQNSAKDLYLSTGGEWVKVDLKEDTRASIDGAYIKIERVYDSVYLSNEDAYDFARSIAKTAQKEKIEDKSLEGYHNAKERLKKFFENKKKQENNPSTSATVNCSASSKPCGRGHRDGR